MKEVLDSVKENLNWRLKNPFFGSFVISWVVVNWKAISFFFFANYDIETKMLCMGKDYSSICLLLWIPLLLALLYTLFYFIGLPYLRILIKNWTADSAKKERELRYGDRDKELDKQIEIAKKESDLQGIRSGSTEIAELTDKNILLKNQLVTRDAEISLLNEKLNSAISECQTLLNDKESAVSLHEASERKIESLTNEKSALEIENKAFKEVAIERLNLLEELTRQYADSVEDYDKLVQLTVKPEVFEPLELRSLYHSVRRAIFRPDQENELTRAFEDMKPSSMFGYFQAMVTAILTGKEIPNYIPTRALEYFTQNGLIVGHIPTQPNSKNKISLTAKGSFFVNLLGDEIPPF